MKEKYLIIYIETIEMRVDFKRFETIQDANDWINEQPENVCTEFAGEILHEFEVKEVAKVITKELKKL